MPKFMLSESEADEYTDTLAYTEYDSRYVTSANDNGAVVVEIARADLLPMVQAITLQRDSIAHESGFQQTVVNSGEHSRVLLLSSVIMKMGMVSMAVPCYDSMGGIENSA